MGIASKDSNKLNKFQEEFEIDNNYCFNNYENLLKNNNIDIIYIALPTSFHHEWISKCLEKGKKVLVEKPATMNSSEIIDIKKNYFDKEIFFSEAFMYMYHPQIKKTVELINEGEIGKLISMESSFGIDILTKKNFFGFKPAPALLNPIFFSLNISFFLISTNATGHLLAIILIFNSFFVGSILFESSNE